MLLNYAGLIFMQKKPEVKPSGVSFANIKFFEPVVDLKKQKRKRNDLLLMVI